MQFEDIPLKRCLSAWNSSGMVKSSPRVVVAVAIEEEEDIDWKDYSVPFL